MVKTPRFHSRGWGFDSWYPASEIRGSREQAPRSQGQGRWPGGATPSWRPGTVLGGATHPRCQGQWAQLPVLTADWKHTVQAMENENRKRRFWALGFPNAGAAEWKSEHRRSWADDLLIPSDACVPWSWLLPRCHRGRTGEGGGLQWTLRQCFFP